MTIGWGIISAGNHPDRKVVPAMKTAPNTDVVAAYSRSMDTAQEFARKHDIPNAYDSLDALLPKPSVPNDESGFGSHFEIKSGRAFK